MRAFFVLLTLIVFALSVMPCCTTDGCANDDITTEQTDSHDSDTDTCSPFYSCSACIGFAFTHFSIEAVTPILLNINYYAEHQQNFFTQFHHTIWQPPKIS